LAALWSAIAVFVAEVSSATSASIDGGAGHDLIINSADEAFIGTIQGGEGNDSITLDAIATAGQAISILGGAGADSISLLTTHSASDGSSYIDGGDGSDTIFLKNITGGANGTVYNTFISISAQLQVVYGAGDVIKIGSALSLNGTANWQNGGIINASTLKSAISGLDATSTHTGVGSVGVYSDGTDSYIAIRATNAVDTTSYVIKIKGKDLNTVTTYGSKALNSTNFGFTIKALNSGMTITLT